MKHGSSPEPASVPVVGTAGWAIPAADRDHFAGEGTALERYATRFGGVEINSSFHRPHRLSTWQRWGDSVPAGFAFAVKMPKTISHQRKLVDCRPLIGAFLDEVSGLGDKLSILLLQLPPKLEFQASLVESFLKELCPLIPARLVCEPRHPSWFEDEPDALLDHYRVARVAADPACVPAAALPGGWRGLSYWRLHGAPLIYRSSYDEERLDHYAALLDEARKSGEVWCMFDNTASSAATSNALNLIAKLGAAPA